MLAKEITDSILTIGCEYRSPKGGVAQVIDSYFKLVFATFFFLQIQRVKVKCTNLLSVLTHL